MKIRVSKLYTVYETVWTQIEWDEATYKEVIRRMELTYSMDTSSYTFERLTNALTDLMDDIDRGNRLPEEEEQKFVSVLTAVSEWGEVIDIDTEPYWEGEAIEQRIEEVIR